MPVITTNLLTAREQQFYYQIPAWSSVQRTEAFTFSPEELKQLRNYEISSGIYFSIALAYFKQRHTLMNIDAGSSKQNIEHLVQRYYNQVTSKIKLPIAQKTKARIENKVLELCGYRRCRHEALIKLKNDLQKVAPRYPKQRALCKALIDFCACNKISLPGLSTLSSIVREVWQNEQKRIINTYKRYSKRAQRQQLVGLINKGERLSLITLLQQEMKGYNTTEIDKTLEQHTLLFPAFLTAKEVIPKLKLPASTIQYYASLISYYKGNQLTSLDPELVQLYLLCYSFLRFQQINDQLLEAFKKRALTYYTNAKRDASANSALQLADLKQIRKNISDMLLAIKRSTHKTHIPKTTLFRYIPESELEATAQLLLNENLDPDLLFWKEVDKQSRSIQLNLRTLFLTLDISILRHEPLQKAIEFLKTTLSSKPNTKMVRLPKIVTNWLPIQVCSYLLTDGECHLKRLEFWLYYQLAQQVKSNKLTLKYTAKYKAIQDDLLSKPAWEKSKPKILKTLPYIKLKEKPKTLITELSEENKQLFQEVNHTISNGYNTNVIITNTHEVPEWRLKPLEEENPPNESIFEKLPKRSIVDLMQFVDKRIHFTDLFDSIAPRSAKHARSPDYILASILANGLRLGTDEMGNISDLNLNSLLSVEKSCIRMETITAALHAISDHIIQLPIFKDWNIDGLGHGSLDGMKIPIQFSHNKAQPSPKYFNRGVGLSSYSLILNHFPLAGKLIGANEYEGHFAFELSQFQYAPTHLLQLISTDKHGVNSINFLLFYLVDKLFAPRIPKPHNETLWGFETSTNYNDYLLRPNKNFNEALWYDEWDNVQHVVASILTGDANANVIVNKLASSEFLLRATPTAWSHINFLGHYQFFGNQIKDIGRWMKELRLEDCIQFC